MNKIIIFDWGGVILKEYPEHYCDQDAIIETIKKFNNNLTDNDAYQLYLDTLKDENNRIISIFNDYESKYKWYERIHNNGKLNTTYEEFINEFTYNYNKIDKYEEVVNYIYTLKDKTNLVLFSDLIFACFSALENTINLNIFDKIFLSYEEGYVKSNIEAFINVEKKLNIKAENILFIDNNENNINNAKKRGWNTCLAFGYELDKIKNTVDEFLKI
jgi:HAD superfamily hydrolase (TIGR01509 family)